MKTRYLVLHSQESHQPRSQISSTSCTGARYWLRCLSLVLDLREYSILNFNSGRKWGLLICWIGSQQCTVIQHKIVVFSHSLYLLLFLNQSSPLDPYFQIHLWCIFLTFPFSGKMTFCCCCSWGIFAWWLIYSNFLHSYLRKKSHLNSHP